MKNERRVQIGVMSRRTPTGEFMPSVPLYARTDDAVGASGLTESEENLIHSVAGLFASKHFEMTEAKHVTI